MENQISELREVFPKMERLVINGKVLQIQPFLFKQFADALEIVSPVLSYIATIGFNTTGVISAICSNANIFVKLVELATGEDEKFLSTITAADGFKLVRLVVEMNKDFFQNELPALLKDLFPDSQVSQEQETSEPVVAVESKTEV